MIGVSKKSVKPARAKPDKGKAKAIPAVANVTRVRRVDRESNTVEDTRGLRYAVWEVSGCDCESAQVIAGWRFMLNSLEFPVQFLVRQHQPDLAPVRRQLVR